MTGDGPARRGLAVAGALPAYRDAGASWFIESPKSGPGWLDAVRERIGREPEVQSPRG